MVNYLPHVYNILLQRKRLEFRSSTATIQTIACQTTSSISGVVYNNVASVTYNVFGYGGATKWSNFEL